MIMIDALLRAIKPLSSYFHGITNALVTSMMDWHNVSLANVTQKVT